MAEKIRIDMLLVSRGLAESRTVAQKLIMAGQVRVEGETVNKPSERFTENIELQVIAGPPFVSRGGEKLEAALEALDLRVTGRVCADVGASTGGFTDCLLQRGALRVYAIDVGHGILHWKMRNHPRVEVMERTNARLLRELPEAVSLVTVDASFISLRTLYPAIRGWLEEAGELLALVKPQFEAGKEVVDRGAGVVRDPAVHRRVLVSVIQAAHEIGLIPQAVLRSALVGPKGNVEFFLHCKVAAPTVRLDEQVEAALQA